MEFFKLVFLKQSESGKGASHLGIIHGILLDHLICRSEAVLGSLISCHMYLALIAATPIFRRNWVTFLLKILICPQYILIPIITFVVQPWVFSPQMNEWMFHVLELIHIFSFKNLSESCPCHLILNKLTLKAS